MTGLLVQRVEPLSPAYDAGIERGSIILQINRQDVNSVAGFSRVLEAPAPATRSPSTSTFPTSTSGTSRRCASIDEADASSSSMTKRPFVNP